MLSASRAAGGRSVNRLERAAREAEAAEAREAVALLLLRETHALAGQPFVIVFLAAGMANDCGETLDFLRELLTSLPMAIHQQLRKFYLVHPNLGLRVAFTVVGVPLWGKLKFVDYLYQLHTSFGRGTLLVPEAVALEDDRRLELAGGAPPSALDLQSSSPEPQQQPLPGRQQRRQPPPRPAAPQPRLVPTAVAQPVDWLPPASRVDAQAAFRQSQAIAAEEEDLARAIRESLEDASRASAHATAATDTEVSATAPPEPLISEPHSPSEPAPIAVASAKDDKTMADASSPENAAWACATCTLVNEPSANRCAVCDAARGLAIATVADLSVCDPSDVASTDAVLATDFVDESSDGAQRV
jgi:hypothetical protein